MIVRKTVSYLLLLTSLLLCTSCFEILEEINLNTDGSGQITVTFNLSKSKSKLASIMLLDSVNGRKVPSEDDINLALRDAVSELKKAPGISNIKKTADFDNYIFTISCDFEEMDSVNAIFKDAIAKQNKRERTQFATTNFSFNKGTNIFKRHFVYDPQIKKSFARLKSEDRKIFDDASYTAIYRFPKPVMSVSNKNAKVSPSKTAVMLKIDAMSLIMGEKNIENSIQLRN